MRSFQNDTSKPNIVTAIVLDGPLNDFWKRSYRITIDDPKIFTEPWSQDFRMTYHPDWEETGLLEYVCQENNRCIGGNCKASNP